MTPKGGANSDGTVIELNLVPEPSSVVLFGSAQRAWRRTVQRRRLRKRAACKRKAAADVTPSQHR